MQAATGLTWEMGVVLPLSLGAVQGALEVLWGLREEEWRASRDQDWQFLHLMQPVAVFQRPGGQSWLGSRLMRSLANWHLIFTSRQHMVVYHLAVLSPAFCESGCGPGRLGAGGGSCARFWVGDGLPWPSWDPG